MFADDTKARTTVQKVEDQDKLPKDLDSLQDWSRTWLLKFSCNKCKMAEINRDVQRLSRDVSNLLLNCDVNNLRFVNTGRFMEDFDPEQNRREMRKVNAISTANHVMLTTCTTTWVSAWPMAQMSVLWLSLPMSWLFIAQVWRRVPQQPIYCNVQ